MKCSYLFFIVWYILNDFWFKPIEAIMGGSIAELNNFKSVVSIQANNEHICGGAIIGESHILTAAHCVVNDKGRFINQKLSILANADHLRSTVPPAVRVDVLAVFVPETYKPRQRIPGVYYYPETADIAVLKLKHGIGLEKMGLKSDNDILNIPETYNKRFFNKNAVLAGFGVDYVNRGIKRNSENVATEHKYSPVMKFVEILVIHKNACKSHYTFDLNESQLCAQVIQNDVDIPEGVCNGDDGSPLIVNGKIIGILAQFRHDCNEQNRASIYTNVTHFKKFINTVLRGMIKSQIRTATYEKRQNEEIENLVEMQTKNTSINLDLTL